MKKMIDTLIKTLEIDIAYSVNSFIYTLRKLPVLKDLLTNDIYSSKILKKIIGFIGIIGSLIRVIIIKIGYFFLLYFISKYIFPSKIAKYYIHIYIVFTIIGMFINNKLLNTSKKKYFSIILFNMDATNFFKATLIWNNITNLVLNTICFLIINLYLKLPISIIAYLITLSFTTRLIGEALNILFYKKYKYIWYTNTKLYFSLLIILLTLTLLPYLNLFIGTNTIIILVMTSIIGMIPSIFYLKSIKDYKLIYKKLNKITDPMNSKNEAAYLRQAMVEVSNKDREIDYKKIKGKEGYELFNTIFFERHKEILLRSSRKYSIVLIGIYFILIYLIETNIKYKIAINYFLQFHLGWFVIIMYFINRGAIVTQAMFFNCDHAMLRYNFFREPKTIVALFKKRLKTISKINLLPALVMGLGNTIILILNNNNMLIIISTFLFIIFLSIFFSLHYLVIYYLLQPYNKNMQIKKISYSITTIITYILSYQLTQISMNSIMFSVLGLIFTTIYIIVALILVKKLAPKTFKLN